MAFSMAQNRPLESIATYSPVIETISPHPGNIFFKNINKYDSFVIVYPSKGITKICTGGLSHFMFVPYIMNSKNRRGLITLASESVSYPITFVHEFFHNIEGAYFKKFPFISHVYKDSYKKHWP